MTQCSIHHYRIYMSCVCTIRGTYCSGNSWSWISPASSSQLYKQGQLICDKLRQYSWDVSEIYSVHKIMIELIPEFACYILIWVGEKRPMKAEKTVEYNLCYCQALCQSLGSKSWYLFWRIVGPILCQAYE